MGAVEYYRCAERLHDGYAAEVDDELPDVATVIDVAEVDERIRDLAIASPAVGVKTARLILPDGFDEQPDRTWPVLYLLHGQGGNYTNWTEDTDIAPRVAEEEEPVLVAVRAEDDRHLGGAADRGVDAS